MIPGWRGRGANGNAAPEIQITPALHVPDIGAFPTAQHEIEAGVGGNDVAAKQFLDGLGFVANHRGRRWDNFSHVLASNVASPATGSKDDLRPDRLVGEHLQQGGVADATVEIKADFSHAGLQRGDGAVNLGNHPLVNHAAFFRPSTWPARKTGMSDAASLGLRRRPGTSLKKTSRRAFKAMASRRRRDIGIAIVNLSAASARRGADDGNETVAEALMQRAGADLGHLADETQIHPFLIRPRQPHFPAGENLCAGKAFGPTAQIINRLDYLRIDLAGQHAFHHAHRRRVGDAQTLDEPGLEVPRRPGRRNGLAAAVH